MSEASQATSRPAARSRSVPAAAALAALAVLAALLLAVPHLADQLWYDEAYTLEFFASGGLGRAFGDYHAPNNHVLFSAALSLWAPLAGGAAALRLLPLAAFLAAVAVLWLAVDRLAGPLAATLAALLLAAGHVALSFALQLRGYGPSWLPVAGALAAAAMHLEKPRLSTAALYAACASLAVGLLPTNLLAVSVTGVWAAALLAAGAPRLTWRTALHSAGLLAAPLPGLVCYLGVWGQFLQQARSFDPHTGLTRLEVAGSLPAATLPEVWWLWPLVAVGLAVLAIGARRERSWSPRSPRGQLLFVAACLAVPPAALLAAPRAPFPRTLVPLLPLWWTAAALPAAAALRRAGQALGPRAALAPAAVVFAALPAMAALREADGAGYWLRHPRAEDRPQDLHDHYYHHGFRPAEAVAALRDLARRGPCLALTDEADIWSLRRCSGGAVAYYRAGWLARPWPDQARGRAVFIVTCSPERARKVAEHLAAVAPEDMRPAGPPREIRNTGFFKIYECPTRWQACQCGDFQQEQARAAP